MWIARKAFLPCHLILVNNQQTFHTYQMQSEIYELIVC